MKDVCSDAEMIALINEAQSGNPKAYNRLYDLYAEKLFRYLYLRVGEREPAEDLMAEVFARLVKALPRYRTNSTRPVAAFSAWLFRIAANLLTDYYRRQHYQRHTDLAESANLIADDPSPSQHVETGEIRSEVWAAIGQLNPEQQAVIFYRFVEQWSLAEVADLMGKSLQAVKALQHRALANLRRLLATHVEAP